MKEREIVDREEFTNKNNHTLLVLDESSITCAQLPALIETLRILGENVIVAYPEHQYRKGNRGFAKLEILSSVCLGVSKVILLDKESFEEEQKGLWQNIVIIGPLVWQSSEASQLEQDELQDLQIAETSAQIDREMINRAWQVSKLSNCWLDPAGAVFVREGEILVESPSTRLSNHDCTKIPIRFNELDLNQGERMMFCDSLHAERVGISLAAKTGIALVESTMYVTKFPCRPCAQNVIAAGVTCVIFNKGSYGLNEAEDMLIQNGVTLKRVVTSQLPES